MGVQLFVISTCSLKVSLVMCCIGHYVDICACLCVHTYMYFVYVIIMVFSALVWVISPSSSLPHTVSPSTQRLVRIPQWTVAQRCMNGTDCQVISRCLGLYLIINVFLLCLNLMSSLLMLKDCSISKRQHCLSWYNSNQLDVAMEQARNSLWLVRESVYSEMTTHAKCQQAQQHDVHRIL